MKKDCWFFGLFLFVFITALFFAHVVGRMINVVVVSTLFR